MDTPFVINRTRQPHAAAEALRASDMFGGLSDPEVLALASLLALRRVTRHSTVFHQGDEGMSLFVVERGTIHCHMVTDDGRELTVAVVGPGEIVGELAFLDGQARSATATALDDSELWVLSCDDFYSFVRRTYDELRKRSFASTEARLAQRLVGLARVHGRPTQQGVLIAARTTQGQLAELIGRSRVTVNKTLVQFEADGLIQRVGHRIVVRDIRGLKGLADSDLLSRPGRHTRRSPGPPMMGPHPGRAPPPAVPRRSCATWPKGWRPAPGRSAWRWPSPRAWPMP